MTVGDNSTVPSRLRLGTSLRRARATAGRSAEDVAAQMDCPLARFHRMEAGLAVIRLADVRDLLDLYGVGGGQREEVLAEAHRARDRTWWYPYADLIGEPFETQLILEDDAASLRTYQPNLVPGLLQTERYAWELIGTQSDLPLETVRHLASLRTMRQQVLSRDNPLHLTVILDEAVLRRPVGPAAVMREQYAHLAAITDPPEVAIRVLPFEAGPHHAMGVGFHIYEFAGEAPPVVELELLDRVDFAESHEVAHYTAAFEQVSRLALTTEQSVALLSQLARNGCGYP